jgi:hypothetical protein
MLDGGIRPGMSPLCRSDESGGGDSMRDRLLPVLIMAVLSVGLLACGGEGEEPQAGTETETVTEEVTEETTEETAEEPAGETTEEPAGEAAETAEGEMTEEEMTAWVMEQCICPQCPSWIPEAAEKGEGGYCAVGESECIVEEVGCICPDCPVTAEKDLQWGYYCTRGSAAEMREEEASE